jgi:hypothetical protein
VISRAEFESWAEFYRLWPFDDLYRYHRPAGLVAHALNPRNSVADMVRIIVPPPDAPIPKGVDTSGFSDVDLSVLRAFGKE